MEIFKAETIKTIDDILSIKEAGDLCFALLTDSHTSDEGETTCANISAVDTKVHFDFVCHLGNLINGNNPKRPSVKVLADELDMYRRSTKSQKLFVTRGDNDGWRDERYIGQMIHGIMTDDVWWSLTDFIDDCPGVSRPEGKPYYYVDFPQCDTRLIFLCSYHSQHDEELEFYQRYTGFDAPQVKWLKECALSDCGGKDIIIFSHRIPLSRFETGKDPFVYKGNSTEPVLALVQRAKKDGANIVCHFGGAYGLDETIEVGGINHCVIASQVARGRELGTAEQDLWDAVVVKKNQKKMYLFRFGAGEDRVIDY